jgi:Domain of unknown function (DUF4159)
VRFALSTIGFAVVAGVALLIGSHDADVAPGEVGQRPGSIPRTSVPSWLAVGASPTGIVQRLEARRGDSAAEGASSSLNGQRGHEFYFTRGIYSDASRGFYGGERWAIDYPKADIQFLIGLRRLTGIDAYDAEHTMALDDPDLRRYPFLYILEVGYMSLPESEVEGLRNYLLAGGFMVVDDFWGTREWYVFEQQMKRVFPDRPIVDVPLDHEVFHIFYDIDELLQVPNVRQGHWAPYGGPTYEKDGYFPRARGVFDDKGRLMVLINWNTDLGDAWEWADDPYYPLKFSTFAYEMGVNFIIYGMSY